MTNDSRTGAFWERHNKLMQDPEHAARFDAELARIRAVDAQVNANGDLPPAPAPVSDARREDVARVDLVADTFAKAFEGPHCTAADLHGADCTTPGGCYYHDAARAVLAVLPAPPVVDAPLALYGKRWLAERLAAHEAEVRERIAQDIEADRTPAPWSEGRREESVGHWLDSRDATKAARIARGATRG